MKNLLTFCFILYALPHFANWEQDSIRFNQIDKILYDVLMSDPDSAFALLNEQKKIVAHYDSWKMDYNHLKYQGGYYWVIGHLDRALHYFHQCLKIALEQNHTRLIGGQYNNIAIIYNDLEDWSSCLEFNLKSLALARKVKIADDIAVSHNNLGNAYMQLDSLALAQHHIDSSIYLSRKTDNTSLLGLAYSNKALVAFHNGNYADALTLADTSIRLSEEVGANKTIVHVLVSKAETYEKLGLLDQAVEIARQSLELSDTIHFLEGMEESAKLLARFARKQHLVEEELKYHLLYSQYRDSLFNKEMALKIVGLERDMAEEQHRTEMAEASLKGLQLLKQKEQQQFVLWLVLSGLAIALLVVYLFYNRYRNIAKRKIQQLLLAELQENLMKSELENMRHKNRELLDSNNKLEEELLHYTYKLERKQQLEKEIREKLTSKGQPDHLLRELNVLLGMHKTSSADWEEFILRFERVHHDFFSKLKTVAKKLTPTDLKICAFLKMNLNSKQMAGLLNIESSSVDMARYRLRKNLGLDKDENLIAFINNI